jgi:prepilin-type N-terminal cleavage/methylation domain-containing protein
MNGMQSRIRSAVCSEERGLTLVEMMVTMMILGIALAIFMSVLFSVQRGVVLQEQRTARNDQARLAIQALDRELRSGNLLYDPASESVPYYSLRIYTQSNAPTRATPTDNPTGTTCVQWLLEGEKLQTRQWVPYDATTATSWRTVAEGIVNRSVSPNVPLFTVDPDPYKGGRTIQVTLLVNDDYANHPEQTIRLQAALTGRNTTYGYLQNACTPP